MANKAKNKKQAAPAVNQKKAADNTARPAWMQFRWQVVFLSLLCFVFYYNTFHNGYAVDDFLIIDNNPAVNNGIAGIPQILSSDVFENYYKQYNAQNRLSGGRYRPLALVTYALEQQFFGQVNNDGTIAGNETAAAKAKIIFVRHVDNVMLYILSVIALLYFLSNIVFPGRPLIAFLSVLLFTIHPIHTEVVANIKSRDEILSLLFITLTFIYAFRYRDNDKLSALIKALLCFFLALLSKEYAVILVVMIPLLLYLLKDYTIPKALKAALPFCGVLIASLVLRFSLVSFKGQGQDNELLNNPYLLASPAQKIATEIATLLNYLKLLIFPHPLSSDYSYNAIPYKDWTSALVWLSIVVHAAIVAAFVYFFRKRHIISFAIAFYLLPLFLVSNLVFSIGATMGERLIYHSSLGFCMVLAYLLYEGYKKIQPVKTAQAALTGLMVILILLCAMKTIARNEDWKSNSTLYLKDVDTVPNSALANGNAGASYNELANLPENADRKKELLDKAVTYLNKAISLHPGYTLAYVNRGTSYFELGEIEKAKQDWDSVRSQYPTYPSLPQLYSSYYINSAVAKYGSKGKIPEAIAELKKGISYAPDNPVLWYNLAYYYYTAGNADSAIYSWQQIIKVAPDDTLAAKAAASIKALKTIK